MIHLIKFRVSNHKYGILRDQSGTRVERHRDKLAKISKVSQLLARPTRFELVTLGLEIQGIGYTNDIVLHRFVIL